MVRIDLDDKDVPGCHPVVAAAVGVPFAPEDPDAVDQLAYALTGSPPDAPQRQHRGRTPAGGPGPGPEPDAAPSERGSSGWRSGLEIGMALSWC